MRMVFFPALVVALTVNSCVSVVNVPGYSAMRTAPGNVSNCQAALKELSMELPTIPQIQDDKKEDHAYVERVLVMSIDEHRQALKAVYAQLQRCVN